MTLAPMADVTDPAFRYIIAKYGKPDVMWTEFVSADGLFKGGYDVLIKDLAFDESERPIVAQFFTSSLEMMEKAGRLANELGFDGVDINIGCPDKSVEKQGAGAALIKNPKLAQELILSAKRGAGDLPVSVKTRIGYNKNELETWLPTLLEAEPAVITIHARTRKEMSLVPARWEHVKRAVKIRNAFVNSNGKKSKTLIFGNGDLIDIEDARRKCLENRCDGAMLGRAIFGNPWLFSESKLPINVEEKLKILIEHTKLFEEMLPHKNFSIMKKHFKAYVTGFDVHLSGWSAKELRIKLMETNNSLDVEKVIEKYIKKIDD
ncbi:MAG: tRNA-dihydrouridine synthase family protein [Minisyncoccia bacterium]